ncbi:MAG TPA: sulfite exporter TauE/SafE family protein [Streptosporangiaceae bacterium]|nr:sulfite exporter TauE/SafE family protein [Streptosporangiaceae bacterium]
MTHSLGWEYWYVFPLAVVVAITANASGFSGGVLFQPFFNFAIGLPIHQSIATGVATETVGMSSGACRYLSMDRIDRNAARLLLPAVLIGVGFGLYVFLLVPRGVLRLIVGVVVAAVAVGQLYNAGRRRVGVRDDADLGALRRHSWVAALAGSFSACTGTGVAEMHQPLLEYGGGLRTKRANATAIFVEAVADWAITCVNLSVGNLRLDILVFSAPGVLIGAQLGALLSPYLPDRLLKSVFGLCVLGIGVVYIGMGAARP